MSKMRLFIYGLFVSVVYGLVAGSVSVQAFTADPKTYISGDNIFYAYVESGEKVTIKLSKSDQHEQSGTPGRDIVFTIDAPGMDQQKCVIPANIGLGGGCDLKLTAVKNGIWRMNFDVPSDAYIHNEISKNVRWNGNLFNWAITVNGRTGEEEKGRLWSELYAIRQPAPPQYLTDLSLHYISEDGYLYRVIYRGYNGQISTLSADAFGIVHKGTCTTAYRSIATNNSEDTPSFGSCGGSYKLFFERPSDDLPTKATKWDGKEEWVRPNIDRPKVEDLQFTPDDSSSQQSGTISYTLKNFVGQYEVRIDTNGDGSYDGPRDITLKRQIKNLKDNAAQKIKFDGLDRDDNAIPRTQPINIKINIAKSGEIHLVGADIEGREGGIELVRLSGDNVPSFDVCWNDTELGAASDAVGSQLVLDGSSCINSQGGVHKWKYSSIGDSWGNARYIDDWVYTSARVTGKAEIKYPESQAMIEEEAAKRNVGLGVIIAIVVVTIGIVAAVVVVLRRRRQKRDHDNLLPPNQLPPSSPPPPTFQG